MVKCVAPFKLWVLANEIPKFTKYDGGVERRTRCVHFPTRFVVNPKNENEEKRDDTLKTKIKEDESWKFGLLGVLLEALQSLNGNALEMPREVDEFTEEYLLLNNPVGAWLKQYYERTESRQDVVQRTELYNQFLQDTGTQKTQKACSDDMVKCHIYEKTEKGIRYYYGISRKSAE